MKPRQAQAADLLAAGSSVKGAAEQVGVSPMTVFRWLQDPDFKAAIEKEARRLRQRFSKRMDSLRAKACDVLDKILESALEADMPSALHLAAVKLVVPTYTPDDLAKMRSDRRHSRSMAEHTSIEEETNAAIEEWKAQPEEQRALQMAAEGIADGDSVAKIAYDFATCCPNYASIEQVEELMRHPEFAEWLECFKQAYSLERLALDNPNGQTPGGLPG